MNHRTLLTDQAGVVAVEIALMVPVILMLLWLLASVCTAWRMEGATHRATAALADLIANQRLGKTASLQDTENLPVEEAFVQMVSGESDAGGILRSRMEYGLQVSYYSHDPSGPASGPEHTKRYGALTCPSDIGNLAELAPTLSTDNIPLELVRVNGCIKYKHAIELDILIPSNFSSSFIAVRRER